MKLEIPQRGGTAHGSPVGTFATPGSAGHAAALHLLRLDPSLGDDVRCHTSQDEVWEALDHGDTDLAIVCADLAVESRSDVHHRLAPPDAHLFVHFAAAIAASDLTGYSGGGVADTAGRIWWAVSRQARYDDHPDELLIAARFGPSGELGDLTSAMWDLSFRLTTAHAQPAIPMGAEYDYLLAFAGDGHLVDVRSELHRYRSVRLVGAFSSIRDPWI